MSIKLTPHILLNAYSQGIFPMADEDGTIYWYDPNPRAILPLESFHVSHRLRRTMRRGGYEARVNTAFREVMVACMEPGPGREKSWISLEIVDVYCQLHELGFAHSVETWIEGELAGGLYGVAVGGLFAGESMFSRVTDGSKIALVHLVERLGERGFQLLDIQFMTEHLRGFGAVEIPRDQYKQRLARALRIWTKFY
jgi:leucyl/phenylalanyl-tRNA--protein transferase